MSPALSTDLGIDGQQARATSSTTYPWLLSQTHSCERKLKPIAGHLPQKSDQMLRFCVQMLPFSLEFGLVSPCVVQPIVIHSQLTPGSRSECEESDSRGCHGVSRERTRSRRVGGGRGAATEAPEESLGWFELFPTSENPAQRQRSGSQSTASR